MSPIVASFKSIRGYGLGLSSQFNPTGSFDALSSYTVPSGGASSITFAGIPQSGYQHLQLRCFSKSNASGSNDAGSLNVTFNSDTSASYSFHWLYGNGSSVSALASSSNTNTSMGLTNSNNYSASNFTGSIVDILDYTNTKKYKTLRAIGGNDGNGAGFIWLISGLWQKTNAIDSFTITPWSGSFMQYSQFALYGVRG